MQCLTKPIIEYPTNWEYRVIGKDKDAIISRVSEIFLDLVYTIEDSNRSSGGKLLSMKISLEVQSEEQRLELFSKLQAASEILQVL